MRCQHQEPTDLPKNRLSTLLDPLLLMEFHRSTCSNGRFPGNHCYVSNCESSVS
eukprot:UN22038